MQTDGELHDMRWQRRLYAEIEFDNADFPLLSREIVRMGGKRREIRPPWRALDDGGDTSEPLPTCEERADAFRALHKVVSCIQQTLDSMWFRHNGRWRVPVFEIVFSGGRLVFKELAGADQETTVDRWILARDAGIQQLHRSIEAEIGLPQSHDSQLDQFS